MLPLIDAYLRREKSQRLRIALVGGPKGGKSTLVQHLELRYGGRVHLIDETATNLFTSGLASPPRNPDRLGAWLVDFQQVVLTVQAFREMQTLESVDDEVEVILHDRGTADIMAYLPGGEAAMIELLPELTANVLHDQYDLVVHLESLATASPDLFDTKGNETRYETLEQAQAREFSARRAWEKHPNYHFISGSGGIEGVIARALTVIRPYFDQEVERRWLMKGAPDISLGIGLQIKQGYLTDRGKEVRIRQEGDRCLLCGKSALAVKRWEEQVDISKQLFDAMWPLVGNRIINKTRYFLNLPGGPYELDIHEHPHQGLVTIERAFRTEEEAGQFVLPDCFGKLREVTLEPAYRSWQLACQGLPVV